ncbi:acyl-CoA dehydrogenase family protein [Amycolatopsis sp.]|uniref:acyl-CoA dehydrogenase family protein n=1 Tax=Amycolatopsis sp. TaxID=37632 RepID=UPI002B8339D6|nr:acyl-CoA dehydrogenase family protein [Amycolatopsis sp.]HVV08223.1 acyl-CoA dehydrogenase family protein [Amycolatopsis sp.]
MPDIPFLSDCTPLTDQQRDLQRMVREFAADRVAPLVAEANANEKFPREVLLEMGKLGLLGGLVPEEHGGLGLDHLTYSIVIEEMARVDHIAAVYMSMPSSLVGAGLRKYGTEEQKQRWLRPLAQGELFGAGGVTEPRSGSDVAGITTTYRVDGDSFVINGSKAWISNLDNADFVVTFATKDKALGRKGISAFIIPVDTPGVTLKPYRDKLGFRSISTGDVFLEDVRLPAGQLLGEEGQGFYVAMAAVESGRLAVASRAVGQAHSALEDTLSYSQERVVFGQAIAEFQLTKAKIADMATGVVTARLLTHAAARLMDGGDRARVQLSMAKQYASDVMQRVATEAVQVHGAYGTSPEYRVSRIYRDAKVFQLVEGANEIHRLLVADYLLGNRK